MLYARTQLVDGGVGFEGGLPSNETFGRTLFSVFEAFFASVSWVLVRFTADFVSVF